MLFKKQWDSPLTPKHLLEEEESSSVVGTLFGAFFGQEA